MTPDGLGKDGSRRIALASRQSDAVERHQGFQMLRVRAQLPKGRRRHGILTHQLRRRVSLGTGKPSAASDRRMMWRIDAPVSSDR